MRQSIRKRFLFVVLLFPLALSACSPETTEHAVPTEVAQEANASPTRPPRPTSTQPELSALATQETVPAVAMTKVQTTGLNVRGGPGTDFGIVGRLSHGDTVRALAFNADQTWVQVRLEDGTENWVSADYVQLDQAEVLPIAQDIPPPPAPTNEPAESIAGITSPVGAYPAMPPNLQAAQVVHVADGDTVDVLVNGQTERLHLIGLDTPETQDLRVPVQCYVS